MNKPIDKKNNLRKSFYIIDENSGSPSANFLNKKLQNEGNIIILMEENNSSSAYQREW